MPNAGFVVFAVGTGVVVIVVAVAVVLVVLLVTVSMRGRQMRGAQRRGEGRRDLDEAHERAARAEHERDIARRGPRPSPLAGTPEGAATTWVSSSRSKQSNLLIDTAPRPDRIAGGHPSRSHPPHTRVAVDRDDPSLA
jgi:hypothetical protein